MCSSWINCSFCDVHCWDISDQIENGTDAILVLGTTGEPATMASDEKHDDNNFPVGIIFRIIDKFTKMIEPVMMLLIGGLVMGFALALYLPLFGAYQ